MLRGAPVPLRRGPAMPPLLSTKRSAGKRRQTRTGVRVSHLVAGVHGRRRGTRQAREQLPAQLEDERIGDRREAHLLQVLADLLHRHLVRGRGRCWLHRRLCRPDLK